MRNLDILSTRCQCKDEESRTEHPIQYEDDEEEKLLENQTLFFKCDYCQNNCEHMQYEARTNRLL